MKHINRTSRPHKLVALLAGATLFGLASQSALALTASGTVISNQATLKYDVGTIPQTDILSAAATFTVDKKVDLTVTELSGGVTSVSPGQTGAVTSFTVTNTGNDPQDIMLAGAEVATGQALFAASDNFNTGGVSVFVDVNSNGTYEVGADTATHIDSLAAGTSKTVFIIASIPLARINGDDALVSLTATARIDDGAATLGGALTETAGADTAGVDTVFADAAGLDDAVRNADYSARDAYTVVSAVISVTKTPTLLCDPVNGITNPKNIPGAIVRWTVTVSNDAAASASATLTNVTHTLDNYTTHDVGLRTPVDAATCLAGAGTSGFKIVSSAAGRTLGGTAGVMTNVADADGATIAGQDVTIDFSTALPASGGTGHAAGELKIGETATITYNVIVN